MRIIIIGVLCFMFLGLNAHAVQRDLVVAVKEKNITLVRDMLKTGADPNMVNEDGETPLHAAAYADSGVLIDLLLKNGADINKKAGSLEATPIARAVIGRKRNAVKALLSHKPDLEYGNSIMPLLFLAVDGGDEAIMKMLIDAGIDVSRITDGYMEANNVSILMVAAGRGNSGIVKILLETRIDVNTRDQYGDHCLNWAVYYDQFHLVPILLNSPRKVEVNFRGVNGQTALDMALNKKHLATIKLLRRKGAKRGAELQ